MLFIHLLAHPPTLLLNSQFYFHTFSRAISITLSHSAKSSFPAAEAFTWQYSIQNALLLCILSSLLMEGALMHTEFCDSVLHFTPTQLKFARLKAQGEDVPHPTAACDLLFFLKSDSANRPK